MSVIRWFYILLLASGIALITLGVERLLDIPRPSYLQAIIAAAVLVVIISILAINTRHGE